jgi:group II intron reverse transcriptase/maturase
VALREQKTAKADCPCEDKLETEKSKEVRSAVTLETVEDGGAGVLLLRVLDRVNMNEAYKRVVRNGGAAGIDGMKVGDMLTYLLEHRDELLSSIRGGWYKPKPVKRVEIPKDGGGKRMLGIPTVIDRMVQQALHQVLQPIFEPTFSDGSYGFRPGRSAHQAIRKARDYYDEGYTQVVDIDLAQYFDTVNHDMLINMIREQVSDESVIRLIRKFLKSGVMQYGIVSPTIEGVPQGGPLSPLLSNIYLTAFDRMLESRCHKFVRYADDCNIYVKSRRAAERVMRSCTEYLEKKLKLKVNVEKSQTGSPLSLKFLGFTLNESDQGTAIQPHEKPLSKFKARLKAITDRNRGWVTMEKIFLELRNYVTGWLGYYAIADMQMQMRTINKWLRRRIRQIFWKRWKRSRTKRDNLVRLGIPNATAGKWSITRKGFWRIAGSWILSRSLTNKYLESIGYMDIYNRYESLHASH